MLSKVHFQEIFKLTLKYPWLHQKYEALIDLLWEECANENEFELMIKLISRFNYVDRQNLQASINDLVLDIVTTPGLNPGNTIIAAMAADSSPDSSQYLVQLIKPKLQQQGWDSVEIVNTYGVAFRNSKRSSYEKLNIVLIDEFIGSGRTVIGRCNHINNQFGNENKKPNIYVKVLFSSIVGVNKIREDEINLYPGQIIPRGISDYVNPAELDDKLNIMLRLEECLSRHAGTHSMGECTLGYGGTESLFAAEDLNTPNSVFPIFWWPLYADGSQRKTLFTRWVGV